MASGGAEQGGQQGVGKPGRGELQKEGRGDALSCT